MDINEAVARAINAERGAANLTIKQLAEKSGIPERTLIRILKAERDIKVDQLAMLADAFGITPSQLVQESENLQSRDSEAKTNNCPIISDVPSSAYASALSQLQRVTGRDPVQWTRAAYHDPDKNRERESGE